MWNSRLLPEIVIRMRFLISVIEWSYKLVTEYAFLKASEQSRISAV